MKERKSEFEAGGIRVFSRSAFSRADRARKSSTTFSKIFFREARTHMWLVARECAASSKVFLDPKGILKSMLYKCMGGAKRVAVTLALAVKTF